MHPAEELRGCDTSPAVCQPCMGTKIQLLRIDPNFDEVRHALAVPRTIWIGKIAIAIHVRCCRCGTPITYNLELEAGKTAIAPELT